MEIKNLKKEELLKLKNDIDSQLVYLESLKVEKEKLKDKTILSGLEKGDKIFCINFNGSKIYHMDFVKINFYKQDKEGYENWRNFSTSHDTKPMGLSASILETEMDKHYFLIEVSGLMFFYTLKLDTWETDLRRALDIEIEFKTIQLNKDIKKLRTKVEDLISNNNIKELINNL